MKKNEGMTPGRNGFDEAYYLLRADELLASYGLVVDDPLKKLEFLLSDLETAKQLFCILEIPWEKLIPALHQAMLLYYERIQGNATREKVRGYSAELMKCAAFMAISGGTRKKMSIYIHQQIVIVKELIAARKAGQQGDMEGA